jgi:hypothetical protein
VEPIDVAIWAVTVPLVMGVVQVAGLSAAGAWSGVRAAGRG